MMTDKQQAATNVYMYDLAFLHNRDDAELECVLCRSMVPRTDPAFTVTQDDYGTLWYLVCDKCWVDFQRTLGDPEWRATHSEQILKLYVWTIEDESLENQLGLL